MAYDIISEMGFGAPFGFVEKGDDIGNLIKAFHDGLIFAGFFSRLYPLARLIESTWLKRLIAPGPSDKTGLGMLMRVRNELVDERLKAIKEGRTGGRVDLLQTCVVDALFKS
jgi:hypothetical protein